MSEKIKIEYLPIDSVTPYPNNPRINDAAVDFVARSIERYGFRAPICVDKDGVVIYGHTRLRAARKLGLEEIPVYKAVDMTPEQAAEYRLADNSVGEVAVWDKIKLKEEFDGLPNFEPVDFGFFGFKQPEKVQSLEAVETEAVPLEGANEGGGDVLLLDDDPYQDNITDLGIPIFDASKAPTWDDVKDLQLYIGNYTECEPPYMYIWGSGKTPSAEHTDIFGGSCIAFYTEDVRFQQLYPYPSEATTKMLNAGVKMCIMPNFSSYPRMPKVERLFQIYKSHFVARYFQKNGLLVIPDFMPQGDIWEYTRELIPKGCPFAVQLHQVLKGEEQKEWANVIKRQIDYCKPPYVIVYYSPRNKADMESIFDGVQTLWIKTFSAQRAEYRKSHRSAK